MAGGRRGLVRAGRGAVTAILGRGRRSCVESGVWVVGCWARCRRYCFEAAICKDAVGVQGLMRIRAIYTADNALAELPPIELTLPPSGRAAGDVVPVQLQASVTAIGTLKLEAIAKEPLTLDERWQIELNVRHGA